MRADYLTDPGTLQAIINVTQLYRDTTYTYTKSCPKYVIGYEQGKVQIIKGSCVYGGIRDLQGIIYVHSTIVVNLSGYIGGVLPVNLMAYVKGRLQPSGVDLSGIIGIHIPYSITAAVFTQQRSPYDIEAYIGGVLPGNLIAYLVGRRVPSKANLGSIIGTHTPYSISGAVFTKQKDSYNIEACVYGYDIKNLTALVGVYQFESLNASISSISGEYLPAYLKVYPQQFLTANMYGWQAYNLSAYIKRIYSSDISAILFGRYPLYNNLVARLKGVGHDSLYLSASMAAFVKDDLSACVEPMYFNDLPSFLRPVLPYSLGGIIHGWAEAFLSAEIVGVIYPWFLTANVYGRDSIHNLTALINPCQSILVPYSLRAIIHSWKQGSLTACLSGDSSPILSANLTSLGYSSDLHATLRPKMIRLTTVLSVHTMEHHNLSAIVNYPCFYTNYSNLSATLLAKHMSDLPSFIRVMSFDYKPYSLSATTGLSNSYSEVDKLKLRITLSSYEFITEDKFKMLLHVLRSGNSLMAYINAIPNSVSLTANVVAEAIPFFNFTQALKNRERVFDNTYSGHTKSYEVVEFAFKSIVEDYYYSSEGGVAWKSDRLDRWALDVKSYLPKNLALKLKRRLHKATVLYDLRKFSSIDAAMRYTIAYVTEYSEDGLTASINAAGYYGGLHASVTPIYTHSKTSGLFSVITPISPTVIVSSGDEIIKV